MLLLPFGNAATPVQEYRYSHSGIPLLPFGNAATPVFLNVVFDNMEPLFDAAEALFDDNVALYEHAEAS